MKTKSKKKTKDKGVSFQQVCKHLGIEEYCTRIFNSSSTGELMHLEDYYIWYKHLKPEQIPSFKTLFVMGVKFAEKNWTRPESVFQHMPRMIEDIRQCILNQAN